MRDAVRGDDLLKDVWVEGEVGRVTISSAGHGYFSLQDARSQLACVFFRDDRVASPFQPQSGLRVVAHGRVDVFDSQGVYQLYVSSLQPAGFGDLALRFEALKAKLAAEGLFDVARKRPLPVRPSVVAVVTSPTGAVWHDIRNVLTRRWPMTRVLIVPCLVQGDPAPGSIIGALDRLGRRVVRLEREGRGVDAPAVTILARGGGSLEDLWPFNDEGVVRAVVRHAVPVVCGVGHEVDVTLADFAADVRAPTPSAAAELVTFDRFEMAAALGATRGRLDACVAERLGTGSRRLVAERRLLERLSQRAVAQSRERAGVLLDRGTRAISSGLRPAAHAIVAQELPRAQPADRRQVLQGRRVRSGRRNHDAVVHGAVVLENLDHLGDRGALLPDHDVDAVQLLRLVAAGIDPALIDESIDRDRGLAGLAVADDQLALAAADRYQGVDRLEAGLHRLVYRAARDDARRLDLDQTALGRLDLAFAVEDCRAGRPPGRAGPCRPAHRRWLWCA